ncbi:MAG: AEC family transporter [Firmicutes bacterium]|nr:AEC family transporter [Bacillota bacterium]
MDSFLFALNATVPIFLIIVLGWYLGRVGILNQTFADVADKFVFKVASPCLLFYDISTSNLYENFDLGFVFFCAVGSILMFLFTWLVAVVFLKDRSIVSAFAQGAARGSAAILGIAFMQNLYGYAGQLPLMIAAAVPLFNIMAVIILTFSAPPEGAETAPHDGVAAAAVSARRSLMKDSLYNIATNPIILGIVAGLIAAVLRLSFPTMIMKTVSSVGSLTSPLALLCIGVEFDGRKAIHRIGPTLWATLIKLVILPAVFLPIAIRLGYTQDKLISILIMTGSATTVSCFVMAKNMRADHVLTSSIIVASTFFSSITMTLWIFWLRVMGLV